MVHTTFLSLVLGTEKSLIDGFAALVARGRSWVELGYGFLGFVKCLLT